MSETREVIFYRHEGTERTIAQARAHGLLSDGDRVTVVAYGDVGAGDVPVSKFQVYPYPVDRVVIVANGWDSVPLAMVLPRLTRCDDADHLDLDVYAVDEDGATRLY
jgi:hypothetical protein